MSKIRCHEIEAGMPTAPLQKSDSVPLERILPTKSRPYRSKSLKVDPHEDLSTSSDLGQSKDPPTISPEQRPISNYMDLTRIPYSPIIHWIQPATMIFYSLVGVLVAAGHHIYYNSQSGTLVSTSERQQWPIRFGTAFSFVAIASFNIAVSEAYTQYVWKAVRQKATALFYLGPVWQRADTGISQ
jgi:hypothetical protein